MRHSLKTILLSALLGIVIGLPIALIAVKSRARVEDPTEATTVTTEATTEVETTEPETTTEEETTTEIETTTEVVTDPEKISLGTFRITAYCPCAKCCGKWAYNRPVDSEGKPIVKGASGAVLKAGKSIAVDISVIPYGSKVEIDGVIYIAEDRGGAIKDKSIDIYFDSHEDALAYGLQYHEVFLIEEASNE